MLIATYLAPGRGDSISHVLTPLRIAGMLLIETNIILLAMVRNRVNREKARNKNGSRMVRGLGRLIFPFVFSIVDSLETFAMGVCLDAACGFGMPEGDRIIIVGMEYAVLTTSGLSFTAM